MLSNVANGNPGGLARQVADVVLSDAFPPEPEERGEQRQAAAAPPGAEFDETASPELSDGERLEYVGRYYSVELDVSYDVAAQDDSLVLRRRKFDDQEMRPMGDDLFQAGARYQFTRDGAGRLDGFEITTGRVRGLRFERVDRGR